MKPLKDHAPKLEVPAASLVKPISNPWRNRILVELHLRPMSPKQFAHDFPGLQLSTVAKYFRELREWGFIEIAEERRGGTRRGAAEKVYRAIRRVHFDTPHWEVLPLFLREECTGVIIDGLVFRITDAFQAGVFDAVGDQHLSCRCVLLDKPAWEALASRLDQVLSRLFDLEAESVTRNRDREDQLIGATAALMAFRSPAVHTREKGAAFPALNEVDSAGPHFLMKPKTAKAVASPWRSQILEDLRQRPASPKQFSEAFGEPDVAAIGRYFRQLKEWGYLEVSEEKRGGGRRGAVEKIYRAVPRKALHLEEWHALPLVRRASGPGLLLEELINRLEEAVSAGTMDLDTDRHLSWMALTLDQHAWKECTAQLTAVAAWVSQLQEESTRRAAPYELIPATAAMLAFRAPSSAKQ